MPRPARASQTTHGAERPMDPRSRRSRLALIAAAEDLLATRVPDDISITDIAQRAGLSRPTVYQNFANKDAILAAVIQVHIDKILHGRHGAQAGTPHQEEAVDRINALVSELTANRALYYRLIASTAEARVRVELGSYLLGLVTEYIEHVTPGDSRCHDELAHFITGGAIALLEHWTRSAELDSAEERRRISERIWELLQHTVTIAMAQP